MLGPQTERVQIIKCREVRCVIISILYLLLLFGGDILNYYCKCLVCRMNWLKSVFWPRVILTVVLKSLRQEFVKRFGLTLTVTENRTPFSMKVLTSTLLMNLLTTALAIFISFVHTKFSFLPPAARKGKTTSEIRVTFQIPSGHSVLAAIDRCIDTNNQSIL